MKSGFILYADQYPPIQHLTNEQKGILLDAFFQFNMGQEVTFTDPVLSMAFAFFRRTFDRDSEAYDRKCQKNRENVAKRYTNSTTVDGGSEGIRSDTDATNIIQPDNKPTQIDKDTPLTPHGGEGECVTSAPARKAKQPTAYSPDFEHFWQLYPHKIGKDAAWKIYQRRKHEIPTGENMAAILARHAQTEKWQRDGGRYIPHPATWLSQGRWADDVTPVVGIASRETPPSPEAQKAMEEILRERTPEELERNRQSSQKYRQEWLRKRGIDECLSAQG